MTILKEVISHIKKYGKLEISNFEISIIDKYNDSKILSSPFNNYLLNNWIHYKKIGEIYSINLIVLPENLITIKEAEELLGEYHTAYNWRDCYTQFTFNGIQTEYIESIYFEKNNEIIVDKEKLQYIEDDHSGNVTTHDYSELFFKRLVIQYR